MTDITDSGHVLEQLKAIWIERGRTGIVTDLHREQVLIEQILQNQKDAQELQAFLRFNGARDLEHLQIIIHDGFSKEAQRKKLVDAIQNTEGIQVQRDDDGTWDLEDIPYVVITCKTNEDAEELQNLLKESEK